MPLEFGVIVLVPFPFTNQSSSKRRPGVVVSSLAYNRLKPDVVLMPVASQMRPSTGLGETLISGWHAAGLLKPSTVKPLFATLDQTLVLRTLGKLATEDLALLRSAISDILG